MGISFKKNKSKKISEEINEEIDEIEDSIESQVEMAETHEKMAEEQVDSQEKSLEDLADKIENSVETLENELLDGAKSDVLPCAPLRGVNIFPHTSLRFDIGREKSAMALHQAINNGGRMLFLVAQKDSDILIPTNKDYYETGTIVKVNQMLKLDGDLISVYVTGIRRAKIKKILSEEPYTLVETERFDYADEDEDSLEIETLSRMAASMFIEYNQLLNVVREDVETKIVDSITPSEIVNRISDTIVLPTNEYQELLEVPTLKDHFHMLLKILQREIEIAHLRNDIQEGVQEGISQHQKEFYLREQIKVIQEELGQKEDVSDDVDNWTKELDKLKLDKKVDEKLRKEIKRYSIMPQGSPDKMVSRTYIETIIGLPWKKSNKLNTDLKKAQDILNEDHYGMEKVKDRIIEYLAVVQLSKKIKGPILCLVGPPGVGKTSIARSIARANGREFTRMSLGGIRDEAEIRGHRRTYVGSIPGRIITNLKDAKSNNLLFLLDEIDKIGTDIKGDPASALLEVLDPEQNKEFTDHYLEIPFDLSKIMFITTANTTETIPRPLLDRMEVINLSGYTEEEKVKIAKKYLIPKKTEEHGLSTIDVKINEAVVRNLINHYTRESGVRNLEREIANICRKIAKSVVMEDKQGFNVTVKNLEKMLGKKKFRHDIIEGENEIGVTTGLAWTSVGGDTLFVETAKMPGSGKLTLTGKLGDVMQESAKTALSYIRSISAEYKLEENFHTKYDIHIHVPEGATPKDGPSAGVTICTAMMSMLTQKPVRKEIAMTGEITLRGKVLPVGGIKEKVLAAHRGKIKLVILPLENKPDIDEIPSTVRDQIEFVFVENVKDVLDIALVK